MQISTMNLNEPSIVQHGGDEWQTEATNERLPQEISLDIFEKIADLMDKADEYTKQEKEYLRKIEKYQRNIKAAEEMIEKASCKKDALIKRNEFLKNCLDDRECAKKRALEYWANYGIDVNELSTPDDDFKLYEFIYTKLKDTDTGADSKIVNLKYNNGMLTIVEQIPEVLAPHQVDILNNRLTANCVNQKANLVDYKLAMLMIRKDLIKNLASPPKTA